MTTNDLERALGLLGPLEARIMRAVWTGALPERFVVRDMADLLPELAYTTVMTTVARLADKHLLSSESIARRKAHVYRAAATPDRYLHEAGQREAAEIVARYGDAGLAAFAASLDALSPEQRRRLDELRAR
jgi:predicted transcriptional regulator